MFDSGRAPFLQIRMATSVQNPLEQTPEEREAGRRRSFLLHPGEGHEVDYKSAVAFQEQSEFAYKLAKHVLGMCNTGGGFIVIGFKEDPVPPAPDEKMSTEISASYEITRLSQFIEKCVRGTDKPEIKVWHEEHDGIRHPIIEMKGFRTRPFFCNIENNVLRSGALYVRITGARTGQVAGPAEWDELIDICVERRHDDLLRRFASLLDEAMPTSGILQRADRGPRNSTTDGFKDWVKKQREITGKEAMSNEGLEIMHRIAENRDAIRWPKPKLLEAAEKSAQRNTGWPIGAVLHVPEGKPMPLENSIQAMIPRDRASDYWTLRENGDYYFFRAFREDQGDAKRETEPRQLWFDTQIWRVAEAIVHCASLYRELGLDPTAKVVITINHRGLKDRILRPSPDNPFRDFFYDRRCSAEESHWEESATLDDLHVRLKDHVYACIVELCELFEFFTPGRNVVDGIVDEFAASRIR